MSSEKISFSSFGKQIDGTMFCSGMETLAENVIEDNEKDAVLVFPSDNGWAGLRAEDFRLTSENAEAILPLPIYKLNKVLIKLTDVTLKNGTSLPTTVPYVGLSELTNNNGEKLEYFDITKNVVTSNEWNGLFLAKTEKEYLNGIYKDNTFYWEEKSNKISFLSNVYTLGPEILGGIFADNTPVYERLLKSILYQIGNDWYYSYVYQGVSTKFLLRNIVDGGTVETDVRNWKFRIEYVPITTSTKIRARKSEKTLVDYIQPFNQRAEINAASAFGKNLYLTAQKTGVEELSIVKNYTRLKDIPPIGALIRHNGKRYRLTANSYNLTNTVFIQVTHRLSENWSNKSKHVSVDQKFRNWNIPQETLWRNLYWEDFLRVGTSLKESSVAEKASVNIRDAVSVLQSTNVVTDRTVKQFYLYYDGTNGVTSPCSTMGIANSMIFSASMKDNLSAGLYQSTDYACEEAYYCNPDGTLEYANIILGEELVYSDDSQYPKSIKENVNSVYDAETAIFNKTFYVNKDPGEALKFTYQIHLISEDECFFANKFAENNCLVKDWGNTARPVILYLCTNYVREGADVYIPYSQDYSIENRSYSLTFDDENYTATLELNEAIKQQINSGNYKAWVITDENNNIYVGCNDITKTKIYFQLHHKR